jgi:hypothetical protein
VRSPSFRTSFVRAVLLAAAVVLASMPSRAADLLPVLLVVPAGSEVTKVEAARAMLPPSRDLLIVGAAERIPLQGGMELVADRSFSEAPASDLVVVLPGEAAGAEEFLAARRATAKAILFLGDSPLVKRLKKDGSRGALILIGGPEAVRALAAAGTVATPSASETSRPGVAPTPQPTAAVRAAPTPAGSAVGRYFSAPTPTPTSVPPARTQR